MNKKRLGGYVYVLHFTDKLSHAQHYIGFSQAPLTRIARHKAGYTTTRIIQACHDNGIGLVKANIIPVPHRIFERRLKAYRKASTFCKYCSPKTYKKSTQAFLLREVKKYEERR